VSIELVYVAGTATAIHVTILIKNCLGCARTSAETIEPSSEAT
jgi:hypothetical protein